jgi:histidine triad (HIT) family protein
LRSSSRHDSISNDVILQQSHEPAGDQQIWHYHLHVIARYQYDDFHTLHKQTFSPDLRAENAQKLRSWLKSQEGSTNE